MKTHSVQLLTVLLGLCLFFAADSGAEPTPDRAAAIREFEASANAPFVGIPTDWTTHHVVFSKPSDAATLDRLRQEPRYWLDQLRRSQKHPILLNSESPDGFATSARSKRKALNRDWNQALGPSANSFTRPTYPAKYSFNATAGPCTGRGSDYVVYSVANTSSAQFNLIGYENLYVNSAATGPCVGTEPLPKFVYNASQSPLQPLGGEPVISLDGTRIALVESQSHAANQAIFHVLLWREGDVPTPNQPFPLPFNSSDGATTPLPDCVTDGAVAPCEFSLTYSTSAAASTSSPYIDYGSDTAYVTDDGGHVLAITPVFNATPASPPAIVSGWGTAAAPTITTTGGHPLTPPVFDPVSQNVFVTDVSGTLFYIRTNSASAGSCASGSPPCLGANSLAVGNISGSVTQAAVESPLIDVSIEKLYQFSGGRPPDFESGSFIVQTDATLSTSIFAAMGPGTGTNGAVVPAGTFDNAYLNSTDGTGLIYGCGFNAANIPELMAFPITAGVLGTSPVGSFNIAKAAAGCSPLTEAFQEGTTDLLFFGVQNNCLSGELTGCVTSFNITSGFPTAPAPTSHFPAAGGTTGIIIDNTSGFKISTNLYFSTMTSQTCIDYFGGSHGNGECLISLDQVGF